MDINIIERIDISLDRNEAEVICCALRAYGGLVGVSASEQVTAFSIRSAMEEAKLIKC